MQRKIVEKKRLQTVVFICFVRYCCNSIAADPNCDASSISHRNINFCFIFLPVLDANDGERLVYDLKNESKGRKSIGQYPRTIGHIANATAEKLT